VGIIFFASFGFIAGILEVVFSLAAMTGSPGTLDAAVLVSGGLLVAALLLASAYGLLTLQSRSPMLATLAFALSIPIHAYHLLIEPPPTSIGYRGLCIAVAVAALVWFWLPNVRQLYQPRLTERQAAA